MKNSVLLSLFLSTAAFAQTQQPQMIETWGEAIHCEKGIFLSENRAILDVTLENDQGIVSFGKLHKDDDQLESFNPGAQIVVRKTAQDTKSMTIESISGGSFQLQLKFSKLIDAETMEYKGNVDSDGRNMNGMKCTVGPVRILKSAPAN